MTKPEQAPLRPIDEKFLKAAADGMSLDCLDLLNCGARLDAQERAGLYATDLAAVGGHTDTCIALMERGADIKGPMFANVIGHAAYMGHLDTVRKLADLGVPIDGVDVNGWTPLHHAALMGRTEICAFLLSRGADIHARCLDGQMPIHKVPRADSVQTCLELIRHGADVNAKDVSGKVPMHIANQHSTGGMKLLLVAYGADRNEANSSHKIYTPAKCCALLGLTDRLLHLMEQGLTEPEDDPQELARVANEMKHQETAGAVMAHAALDVIRKTRAMRAPSTQSL